MNNIINKYIYLSISVFFIYTLFSPSTTHSQSLNDLRDQINDREQLIKEIDENIDQYTQNLQVIGSEKKTLQNKLSEFQVSQNRTKSQIRKTQTNIEKSNLIIQRLTLDVEKRLKSIDETKKIISKLFRSDNENELFVPYERALALSSEVSSFIEPIRVVYDTNQFKDTLYTQLSALNENKERLEENRAGEKVERDNLKESEEQLIDRNIILSSNIKEQNSLLTVTRREEGKFQELLETEQERRRELELEILQFESRLQFILDPNSIPDPGAILAWPLRGVRITQGFGCTPFAQRNKGIYGGICFHPGIDFGAAIGSELIAPLEGIVRGLGNTDDKRGCYSLGRWLVIDHPNGLSTIYGHLSRIRVSVGDSVKRGEIIGYTGNTGISTGPHLDFRVYASSGLRIVPFERISPTSACRGLDIPTAAKNAKLNPLNYLPNL